MAYFVFCSKMESGYLCYYCNEKFDLFKDIFSHLIEKHNADTFKSHVILCLSYTFEALSASVLIWWSQIPDYLLRLRVANKLNLRLSNLQLMPANLQIQNCYLLSVYLCYYCNEKFDLLKDIFSHLIEKHNADTFKSHVILCLSYTVSKCCSVSTLLVKINPLVCFLLNTL
jgi:predicted small metal-binding protein